jgi:hypothetical protein
MHMLKGSSGQRVGREYFMGAVTQDNIHIVLHEMGHTFALDGQSNYKIT